MGKLRPLNFHVKYGKYLSSKLKGLSCQPSCHPTCCACVCERTICFFFLLHARRKVCLSRRFKIIDPAACSRVLFKPKEGSRNNCIRPPPRLQIADVTKWRRRDRPLDSTKSAPVKKTLRKKLQSNEQSSLSQKDIVVPPFSNKGPGLFARIENKYLVKNYARARTCWSFFAVAANASEARAYNISCPIPFGFEEDVRQTPP